MQGPETRGTSPLFYIEMSDRPHSVVLRGNVFCCLASVERWSGRRLSNSLDVQGPCRARHNTTDDWRQVPKTHGDIGLRSAGGDPVVRRLASSGLAL